MSRRQLLVSIRAGNRIDERESERMLPVFGKRDPMSINREEIIDWHDDQAEIRASATSSTKVMFLRAIAGDSGQL